MRLNFQPKWPARGGLLFVLLCIPLALPPGIAQEVAANLSSDEQEFFEARIRPVLLERCYECHNSGGTAEAGLVLDHRVGLRKGSDQGSILEDEEGKSLLLQVLRHELPGLEMPEGGAKLDNRTIRDFEDWVAMGAPDPRDEPPSAEELQLATAWNVIREKRKQWWSFQPIEVGSALEDLPPTKVIDLLVQRKLEEQGFTSAGPADPYQMIRRVSFALTGLPPTTEQVEEFLVDPSEEAYERLVDQLLSSPQFGERWARHWMDWIRYAESHGSEGDPRIVGAEQYRDYLIRALNSDVPYDQLVREHIAGDLLPEPRRNEQLGINESVVGTAHWRMVFHGFAPTDVLEEKVRFTDDAINVFGKAFLGLTVACARCHNHKFDPISQEDYYALYGILASTRPGRTSMDLPDARQAEIGELQDLKQRIRALLVQRWGQDVETLAADLQPTDQRRQQLSRFLNLLGPEESLENQDFTQLWSQLEKRVAKYQNERSALEEQAATHRWTDPEQFDSWFKTGDGLKQQQSTSAGSMVIAREGNQVLQSVLPSGVFTNSLSDKLGGRLESPDFEILPRMKLWLLVRGGGQAMSRYVVQDYPRNGTVFPVTNLEDRWKWQAYDLSYWDGDQAHIELTTAMDAPLLAKQSPRSWFGVRQALLLPAESRAPPQDAKLLECEPLSLLFEDPRLEPATWAELAEGVAQVTERAVRAWRDKTCSDAQASWLMRCVEQGWLSNHLDAETELKNLVQRYREVEESLPVARRIPTLSEWRGEDSPLLERGDHKRPAADVPRRFLEAIDSEPYRTNGSGRLQLAEDVLRQDNPLTSRVIVNRIWHHLMGRGLVGTPDNFGRLGEQPTHPELLDYLSWHLRERDAWALKPLIRRIVLSETYRQSAQFDAAAHEKDPDNRWLSRFSVRRLEAEAIRDTLLQVSGQLDSNMFGSPVAGTSRRRSVYVNVIRNRMDPFLAAFDSPVPFSTQGRRDTTNVPAQSLMMMNSPFVRQLSSRFAAAAVEQVAKDERERARWMWSQAFARPATEKELARVMELLEELRTQYKNLQDERSELEVELAQREDARSQLLSEARDKLRVELGAQAEQGSNLRPYAAWGFDDLQDEQGNLHLSLYGSAKLQAGDLVLDGKGYAATTSSLPADLKEKSLEVLVHLDDLNQRGGAAFSVQTRDGVLFDAIVYGEQRPQHWISGSNNFRRTRDFQGVPEPDTKGAVHLVIVYEASGKIYAYRNAVPYGTAYSTSTQTFSKDNTQLLFGLRHGTSVVGGRCLQARILQARLFDRALTKAEVAEAMMESTHQIPLSRVVESLAAESQELLVRLERDEEQLRMRLAELGNPVGPNQVWTDLAHALFNSKEFIYVR